MTPASLTPILDHLWQSTAFAGLMAMGALALRKNRAAVRFWLWLAASMKFLVPCALLMELGAFVRQQPALAAASPLERWPALQDAGQAIFTPSSAIVTAAAPAHSHAGIWLGLAAGIWTFGFVFVAIRWVIQWRAVRSLVRHAQPIDLGLPIPAVSAPARLEPGIFGIFRPALFLPAGIAGRLTPEQMQALLEHELCHVRRRDNLWAAMHVLVEAIFWFHPLVWWLGARMVAEREAACDEAVSKSGAGAEAYATSVLEVCRVYAASPMPALAGITGADLKKRVLTIASQSFGRSLSRGKKLALAFAAIVALATPIVFGLVSLPLVRAQLLHANGPLPKYEVATIKPAKDDGSPHAGSNGPDEDFVHDFTVSDLVHLAYDAYSKYQVEGVTSWMTSERFDIEMRLSDEEVAAEQKMPPEERIERGHLMLQELLADRFHLKTSETTKDVAVDELVVAKGGSKLKPSEMEDDPAKPGEKKPVHPPKQSWNVRVGMLSAQSKPISALTSSLNGLPELGGAQIVIDKTGLTGLYDWSLTWTPSNVDLNAASPNPDAPGLFTALEEQLGLKLVPVKAPVEVLVIDHIEQPSPN